ncbi:MAG: hypothetical protein COB41_05560 [Proteobacteria bacterium]|nr:MAG: hypothetical protein COB41_05560 [Pseudomonadota bacterium]
MSGTRVNIPGSVEAIWQPLYDYQTVAINASVTATQRFFIDPVGTSGKSQSDTNMELSGQIPKGQRFQITGVQVEYLPSADLATSAISTFTNDVYNFYKGGHLILKIGSKDFITQGNLLKFPPVNRLALETSTALAGTNNVYSVASGREFVIKDLALESNQNFSIELRDIAARTIAARIGVTLNGYLFRNSQ